MRSDVIYNPMAECPQWLNFLAQVQPDPEVQRFLQTFFGYAATGDIKGQIIPFFVGRGLNGKGVLIKVLRKVFGAYQTVAPKSIVIKQKNGDGHPADLDSVRHARWATLSEFSDDTHFDCGKLQNATGGGDLTARGMGENFLVFDPHVVFSVDTNCVPFIAEPTDAMKRRILIIDWAVSFKGRVDENLADKLCEELPGILNWLRSGAMEYYRGGLKNVPDAILKSTEALWDSVDSVRQWIESECIRDIAAKTDCKILGHSYSDWCKDNLIPPCGNHKFNRRLRSSEIEITKSNSRYFAMGLRLRNEAEQCFDGIKKQDVAPIEAPPLKKPPTSAETPEPPVKKARRMIQ
jgi:putative DNA primase/helicase